MINNSLIDAEFSRDHKYMTMTPDGILGEVPIQIRNCDPPVYFDYPKNVFLMFGRNVF